MFAIVDQASREASKNATDKHPQPESASATIERTGGADRDAGELRDYATGEVLFQEGDPRPHFFIVDEGAICHYVRRDDGTREVIGFAFAGDVIGLGFLDSHATNAQATLPSRVLVMPEREASPLAAADPRVDKALSQAIDREFAWLRRKAVRSGLVDPAARLASLLVALSSINKREGRNGQILSDDITCGFVSDQIGLDVESLEQALVTLEDRGFVALSTEGLKIVDVSGLERLAAGGNDGPARPATMLPPPIARHRSAPAVL